MKLLGTHTKGFTLIELLVVIAIIGVLAGVVLASLNSARIKSADTAAKAAMKQMLNQSQNYLDAGNTDFGLGLSACNSGVFADSQFTQIRSNIVANAAGGASLSCSTSADGSKWAVQLSALRGGGTWCVDNSQGWFKAGSGVSGGLCLP